MKTGLYLHIFSQTLYVVGSFFYLGQGRPVWLFFSMLGLGLLLDVALRKIFHAPGLVSLATIAVCNSVYLNMEGHGAFYWGFHATLALAMLSRYVLRADGRPIFNPSMIGIFIMMMVLPEYAAFNIELWRSDYNVFVVLALGLLTTFYAGTWRLSISHLLGVTLFGSVVSFGFWSLGPVPINLSSAIVSWPATTFTVGYLIYAFHVIGDPVTGPSSHRGQIVYGLTLAAMVVATRAINLPGGYVVAYVLCSLGYSLFAGEGDRTGARRVNSPTI